MAGFTSFFPDVVVLGIMAGLLAIDDRAGWQGLTAQPVFAGALVGWVTRSFELGLLVGLFLELVWLSVLPMRGSRRPDVVVGTVVGAGAVCLLERATGDPRTDLLVATGVLLGLLAGELVAIAQRGLMLPRERWLGDYLMPTEDPTGPIAVRKLSLYHAAATTYFIVTALLLTIVLLPCALWVADRATVLAGPTPVGSRWWLVLLPAFGAAAVIQSFWHQHLNRFLLLSAGVFLVILWIR